MSDRTLIIAEAGVNHDGDFHKAMMLAVHAKMAGADVIKYQTSIPEMEVSGRYAPEHLAMVKRLTLPFEYLKDIKTECDKLGIEFLCTAADTGSLARLIAEVGIERIKISSDNLTNRPFLDLAATAKLPVILSTGMADVEEIQVAMSVLRANTRDDITLMQCTSAYPCPIEEANLKAIRTLKRWFDNARIGFSDHTTSLVLPSIAVALGAKVIEKHLTMDNTANGPDHAASLEPHQFKSMIYYIRQAEAAMGDGRKTVQPSEMQNRKDVRKSLMAARAIKAGEMFTEANIAVKRPAVGRSPMEYPMVIGTVAARDYAADEAID